jgi:hypothetical protein
MPVKKKQFRFTQAAPTLAASGENIVEKRVRFKKSDSKQRGKTTNTNERVVI